MLVHILVGRQCGPLGHFHVKNVVLAPILHHQGQAIVVCVALAAIQQQAYHHASCAALGHILQGLDCSPQIVE